MPIYKFLPLLLSCKSTKPYADSILSRLRLTDGHHENSEGQGSRYDIVHSLAPTNICLRACQHPQRLGLRTRKRRPPKRPPFKVFTPMLSANLVSRSPSVARRRSSSPVTQSIRGNRFHMRPVWTNSVRSYRAYIECPLLPFRSMANLSMNGADR